MSGLTNFLAPFSHMLYGNRNIAIVVLCALLAWTSGHLFIARWRHQRLERDLAEARSNPSAGARTYATPTRRQVEEQPQESGGLPPVKGGRSYARNLGSALQKAGVPAAPIYSPPPPPGWVTNANAGQSPAPQSAPAPYAPPQPVPWAAQQQPAAPQWGYQAGPGRPGAPGPSAPPMPFYQPQPTGPQPQVPTGPPAPGPYAPTNAPGFGPNAFPSTAGGPAAAPYPAGIPGMPPGSPMPPGYGAPVPGVAPPDQGEQDSRRGKPKRRRFNFNVLENLEKMVQAKAPEQPAAASAAPAPAPTAPPPTFSAAPTAPPLAPVTRSMPAATPWAPAPPAPAAAPAEAESLPLQFGAPAGSTPAVKQEPEPPQPEPEEEAASPEPSTVAAEEPTLALEETEPAPVEPEPATAEAEPAAEEATATAESEPVAAAPEPDVEPERKRPARSSMRSMLFGEEAAPPEPTPPTAAPEEPKPVPARSSSFSSRWMPRTEEPATTEAPAEEPAPTEERAAVEEPAHFEEPAAVAESTSESEFGSTPAHEFAMPDVAEHEPEVVTAEEPAEAPVAEVAKPPMSDDHEDRPSAGTLVIIEDDQVAAQYYATLFRGNGFRVEVANDGVSGVDLCARVQPQVILLDVMMPRQNGILVLQTLRASDETKNTPVVVMSNFSEPTLIKRALQLGALEYVIKTQVEGSALLNAVPRWMNREKAFAAAA